MEGEVNCSAVHTADGLKKTAVVVVVVVAVVVVVETGSCSKVVGLKLYNKFVEKGITWRQFMLYMLKLAYSSLICIIC